LDSWWLIRDSHELQLVKIYRSIEIVFLFFYSNELQHRLQLRFDDVKTSVLRISQYLKLRYFASHIYSCARCPTMHLLALTKGRLLWFVKIASPSDQKRLSDDLVQLTDKLFWSEEIGFFISVDAGACLMGWCIQKFACRTGPRAKVVMHFSIREVVMYNTCESISIDSKE
jgi:hypothetical protein